MIINKSGWGLDVPNLNKSMLIEAVEILAPVQSLSSLDGNCS